MSFRRLDEPSRKSAAGQGAATATMLPTTAPITQPMTTTCRSEFPSAGGMGGADNAVLTWAIVRRRRSRAA